MANDATNSDVAVCAVMFLIAAGAAALALIMGWLVVVACVVLAGCFAVTARAMAKRSRP